MGGAAKTEGNTLLRPATFSPIVSPMNNTPNTTTAATEQLPRFAPGTQYIPQGRKHPDLHTVTDVLTTRNLAGALVSIRYVSTHTFLGQTLTNCDVIDPTIARGLVKNVPGPGGNPFPVSA